MFLKINDSLNNGIKKKSRIPNSILFQIKSWWYIIYSYLFKNYKIKIYQVPRVEFSRFFMAK